jgi:cobaltochelatase CobN
MVRLLGGRLAWPEDFEQLRRRCGELGIPLLAFGGEAEPDAELTALSTAPSGTIAEAFEYLRHGGVGNTGNLLRFVVDTLLVEGYGFEPPLPLPEPGVYHPALPEGSTPEDLLALHDAGKPTVGLVFYRAHWMGGNTAFVDALVNALEEAGANAMPVYCYSLRAGEGRKVPALEMLKGKVDCLITTVLAGGGSNAADAHEAASRAGSPEGWLEWEVPALESLGVPVIQGICTTSSREAWLSSDAGLSPLDTAWQVAIPEFDGRIVGVPFSFKERLGEGSPVGAPLTLYTADPSARSGSPVSLLASPASGVSRTTVRRSPSSFRTTRPSTRASATPSASIPRRAPSGCSRRCAGQGYLRRWVPEEGDALIHALINAGGTTWSS